MFLPLMNANGTSWFENFLISSITSGESGWSRSAAQWSTSVNMICFGVLTSSTRSTRAIFSFWVVVLLNRIKEITIIFINRCGGECDGRPEGWKSPRLVSNLEVKAISVLECTAFCGKSDKLSPYFLVRCLLISSLVL